MNLTASLQEPHTQTQSAEPDRSLGWRYERVWRDDGREKVRIPLKKLQVQLLNYGKGLFTVAPIAAGEVIEPLVGYETDYAPLPADLKRLVIYLGDGRCFVITNDVVFANHACDPNCRLDDAGLVALRAIVPGEQLTFNYNVFPAERQCAPEDWWWDPLWSFDCACGSPYCQGRIDGYRWQA